MKAILGTVACAALLVGAPHAALAASQSAAVSSDKKADSTDKAIATKIVQSIKADPVLKKQHVKVTIEKGRATLTGTVATPAERELAETLAMQAGATRVVNEIAVGAGADAKGTSGSVGGKAKDGLEKTKDAIKGGAEKTKDAAVGAGEKTKDAAKEVGEKTKDVGEKTKDVTKDAGEKTKEGAEKTKELAKDAGEKTKEGAEKAADKTKDVAGSAANEVTDVWITTDIKTRFMADKALRASEIKVDSDHHVVTLTGSVPSAEVRSQALEVAKRVNGVTAVIDKLTIKP